MSHVPTTTLQDRLSNAVLKNLPQTMQRAVEALWENFETLDLEIITTLVDAESDFLASLPVIEGYEDDLRQLVHELIEDMRLNFASAHDAPFRLRFSYQNKDELIDAILPRASARLVVMPIRQDITLHTNLKEKK